MLLYRELSKNRGRRGEGGMERGREDGMEGGRVVWRKEGGGGRRRERERGVV